MAKQRPKLDLWDDVEEPNTPQQGEDEQINEQKSETFPEQNNEQVSETIQEQLSETIQEQLSENVQKQEVVNVHENKTDVEQEQIQKQKVEVVNVQIQKTNPELKPEQIMEQKPVPKQETKADTDFAQKLKDAKNKPLSKVEDVRRRQTYLLSKEEIKAVKEMSDSTGYDKYEIVGMAILDLYSRFKKV